MFTDCFAPNSAGTVTVAATATSGSTRVALVGSGSNLLVQNAGTSVAFFEVGTSSGTAAVATGLPIQPGMALTLRRDPQATHAIAITSSGTATVYVTTGEGQ